MDRYEIDKVEENYLRMSDLTLVGKSGKQKGVSKKLLVARNGLKRGQNFNVYTSKSDFMPYDMAYTYSCDKLFCIDFPRVPLGDYALRDFFKQLPGLRQASLDSVRIRIDMMRALMARNIVPALSAQTNLRLLLDCFFSDRRRSL